MSEQGFQVDCSGMAPSTPPDPCIVVIFGVAGDLGRTTLVPALYALACQKLLPEPCAILGVARRDWDDATFRNEMRQWGPGQQRLQRPDPGDSLRRACTLWAGISTPRPPIRPYVNDSVRFRLPRLSPTMSCFIARSPRPSMVALPTSSPPPPSSRARTAGGGWCSKNPLGLMPPQRGPWTASSSPWSREEQLYRVDHYLGKETVQNMLVFRFANPGFEPIWTRQYIDHVQITAAESEGIGTRAGYYDRIGAVRDMVQSHRCSCSV